MELLENSIRRYQNKVLTAAEVIEELIEIANNIRSQDVSDKETGFLAQLRPLYSITINVSGSPLLPLDLLKDSSDISDRNKTSVSRYSSVETTPGANGIGISLGGF